MTLRLVKLAREHWAKLDGLLASRGVDLMLLPPDRYFSTVYWWATRNASEQADLDRFDRQLWRPPIGVAPAAGSPWSPEKETEAFNALAAAFGTLKTGNKEGDITPARQGGVVA